MRANLRLRHFSLRTEEAYTSWTRRYVRFHGLRHPADLGEAAVKAFLIHLAQERHVAPSTLAQAQAALLFLYKEVLERPLAGLGSLPRARAPVRLPVVLSPGEVRRVVAEMGGVTRLVALVLYGSGMRLQECLSLRIKDIDIDRGEIRIRRGKGAKDRVTVLPEMLRAAFERQVESVRRLHDRDCESGANCGWVALPDALAQKYPQAGRSLQWQWVFPAAAVYRFRDGPTPAAPLARVRGSACDGGRGTAQRYYQAGDVPHAATLICDAPAGSGGGHSHRAGAARPSGCFDDDVVHACAEPWRAWRSQSGGSCRACRSGYGVRGIGRLEICCEGWEDWRGWGKEVQYQLGVFKQAYVDPPR